MHNVFELMEETPVYLYGAASIGKIVFEKNPTLNICGFIDARAAEIEVFMGKPVYTLFQAREKKVPKDAVIIISVKNVYELEDIAVELYEAGFDKLIYKSRAVLEGHGSEAEKVLSNIWEQLVTGDFCGQADSLQCFRNDIQYVFTDQAIISKQDGETLAYVPVELIYTNNRNDSWSDINIQGYYPHIYFFYYLSNHKNGQFQDYLEFVESTALEQGDIKITEAWRKNVLRNRTMIYENMRLNLDVDPQFFFRNAATAQWCETGYFHLTSGKHRCAFMVSQGYRYIPLKMSEMDYEKYLDLSHMRMRCDEIRQSKAHSLETKIYHPWFYRYPCREPIYYSLFQVEVLCRIVRTANKRKEIVKLYMNLSKQNSLFRILEQCRLVQIVGEGEIQKADIVLIDEWETSEKVTVNEYTKACTVWHIDTKVMGVVLAEYVFGQEKVYLCEEIR